MEKPFKTQVATILVFFVLLLFIPFISSSLRSSYLYFLLNILIFALALEAGLLQSILKPCDEKKPVSIIKPPVSVETSNCCVDRRSHGTKSTIIASCEEKHKVVNHASTEEPAAVALDHEKVNIKVTRAASRSVQQLKRIASKPSIFFIGSSEVDVGVHEEDEKKLMESGELLSKQELFAKADSFIANFYKQLKMQREESWKKIHELYHRAF